MRPPQGPLAHLLCPGEEGLQRMASEIFCTVLRSLMEHEGCVMSMDQLPTLEVLYRRVGEDRVRQFGLDSAINRLPYDRHGEELALHRFADLLRPSLSSLLASPIAHQLPSWSRLNSCNPSFATDLATAGRVGHQSPSYTPSVIRLRRPNHSPARLEDQTKASTTAAA